MLRSAVRHSPAPEHRTNAYAEAPVRVRPCTRASADPRFLATPPLHSALCDRIQKTRLPRGLIREPAEASALLRSRHPVLPLIRQTDPDNPSRDSDRSLRKIWLSPV